MNQPAKKYDDTCQCGEIDTAYDKWTGKWICAQCWPDFFTDRPEAVLRYERELVW